MTTFTIHPGQRNFQPHEFLRPFWKPSGFELAFRFHLGGWCSLDDWEGDKDWYDWQKLAGLTHFLSANNRRTAMYAFRFGEVPETYEVCPYINDKKGGFEWGNSIIVEADNPAQGFCDFKDGYAKFWAYQGQDQVLNYRHGFDRPKLMRRVGTYAGGANNSPGPHGGRALKTMRIDISFKVI